MITENICFCREIRKLYVNNHFRDNFQTISIPNSRSTCPGLSIKWTGRRLVTDSGTKCAWVIHESKVYKYMYITIAAASMCLGFLVALKIRTTTTTNIFRTLVRLAHTRRALG